MAQQARPEKTAPPSRTIVDRQLWLDAARAVLIDRGVAAVKIEPLAAMLKISRSSFYWNFRSRRELLDALLKYWVEANDRALRELIAAGRPAGQGRAITARDQLRRLIQLFIDEREFSSAFDMAIREWARTEPSVARLVKRIDAERIDLLQEIFLGLGHSEPDSVIRAKILYFHQLGYYLMGIKESAAVRKRVAPRYLEILSGIKL